MQWHDPWALLLLLLVPLLWRRGRRQAAPTVSYPMVEALRAVGPGRRARWRWVLPALRALALTLLVIALARPQLGKASTRISAEGIDIMLAVDVSGSMLAEDFQLDGQRANRLDAVKAVVREFLDHRPNDRVGLVLFAARPYTQSPLTLDHGWLLSNLDRARIGMIEDGTAVGSALATAVSRLEGSQAKSKIVILLTDGQSNAGKVPPLTAAESAKALGYRVYTIGTGTRGAAPYPQADPFGRKVYVNMPVDIDEDTLRHISETTGGRYFRATDTESLRLIYQEIDQLEKTEQEGLQYLEYYELYVWLALVALLLLGGEAVLAQTWLRTLP
ncbi:MAG: VWA domain-containing protein [Deltaproteobacteria bacterium]|nr:VWA domain-containing protein [Deltaproteobacteria bacterium]